MKESPLLLAVDVGTGSCRAVLFDTDGAQVAIGQREYAHAEVPGVPGSQVFDTERNWTLVCACVRQALEGIDAARVVAVSATSMREGFVLYDARGREIWACPNVDSRAAEEVAELVRAGAAEEIYACAGDWVSITAPARLLWIARHEPDVLTATAHMGMLGDWVATRLTGEFATDPSLGSSSGMFALAERDWSRRVLDLVGVSRSIFPTVVEPGTVIGSVTTEAAAESGLRPGTRVVVGGADTQLGLVGIGVVEPGRYTVVGGSFWQQTVVIDEPLIDPQARLRTLCHAIPAQWMLEGIGFYCGLTTRWFRDAFCALEQAQAQAEGRDVYSLLEEQAAALPPGSNGVVGIFSNLMTARHWVHAAPAFVGFDVTAPERSGKRECFRAIEESAAYASLGHLRIAQEISGWKLDDVVLTGGAAKGTLWPQILADVLGVPVHLPAVKESSALGAALFAGIGVGLYAGVEDAGQLVAFERTVEPDPHTHEIYQQLYEQWLEIYRVSLELTRAGGLRPLWQAAGT